MSRGLRRAMARGNSDAAISVPKHEPRSLDWPAVSVTRGFLEVSN